VFGTVGEQREHLVGGQFQRVWREPDLQSEFGGLAGGELQALRVAAGDLDGVAVQIVADDGQLSAYAVRVERPLTSCCRVERSLCHRQFH